MKLSDMKYFIAAVVVIGLFIGNLYLMDEFPLYSQILCWIGQGLLWLGLIFSIGSIIKCVVEGKFHPYGDD